MTQNDGSSMLLSLLYFAAATVTHIKFPFCSYWVSGANAGKKKFLWTTCLGIQTTSDYHTQAYTELEYLLLAFLVSFLLFWML